MLSIGYCGNIENIDKVKYWYF